MALAVGSNPRCECPSMLSVTAVLISAIQALRSSSEVTYLTAFCSADGHLLVNRHYPHAANGFGIHVYALARDAAEEGPTLLATFELPRLNWDFSSWLSASFFPGYGKCTQLAGAGAAGRAGSVPGQVLVQLRIDLQVALYTPLATFLAPRVLRARARGGGPLRIAWAAWGPHACRLVHEEVECAVLCGYKAVYSDYALDFCPVTDGAGDDAVVTAETVVKSSVFAEPVVTRLPYRRVELPFSRPLARNQMYLFFEDVDGPKVGAAGLLFEHGCNAVVRLCERRATNLFSSRHPWISTRWSPRTAVTRRCRRHLSLLRAHIESNRSSELYCKYCRHIR